MSSPTEYLAAQALMSSLDTRTPLKAVVNQKEGKKKEKKRKRTESAQAAENMEPPRKHTIPPTSPRKRTAPHHAPPIGPLSHVPSSSQRDLSRSPRTPVSPIVHILPIVAPRYPKKDLPKSARNIGNRVSQSSPAILSSQSSHTVTYPPTFPVKSAKSAKSIAAKSSNQFTGHKERTIRELRQKLAKQEADHVLTFRRLATAEAQLAQRTPSSSSSGNSSYYSATSTLGGSGDAGLRLSAEISSQKALLEGKLENLRQDKVAQQVLMEGKLENLGAEKAALEKELKSVKEEGREQSNRLVEKDIKTRALAQQVKTATDRGKKWVKRAEEFEVQIGDQKKAVEVQRKRAEEAEEQLEILSADVTLTGTPLRQNLLSAKSALASERLVTQDLRGQLHRLTIEISTKDKTIATRDETIIARGETIASLTTATEKLKLDLAESQARTASLDRECEGHLSELKALLEVVTGFSTDVEAMGKERYLQQKMCDDQSERIAALESSLGGARDRAEWYKAENRKKERETYWWRAEAERIRKATDARAQIDRNKAKLSITSNQSFPLLAALHVLSPTKTQAEYSQWAGTDPQSPVRQPVVFHTPPTRELPFAAKLEIAKQAAAHLMAGGVKEEMDEDLQPSE